MTFQEKIKQIAKSPVMVSKEDMEAFVNIMKMGGGERVKYFI